MTPARPPQIPAPQPPRVLLVLQACIERLLAKLERREGAAVALYDS
eukprot:CAMPEP_0206267388 /NCGR_PEP_ID=MMETSP0047_2-20121206/31125_1 /ASSEMBLY_ACC=CAM_ASM_000192 /TAXON_ID=195065 /ORGANISM="Chroomonas mesostigmatica_cf, Strain CCMP1168" /LENGTH=45 /DNA_ID= /DNA_START= /DNA_END= /DNA_ORIENTATION=